MGMRKTRHLGLGGAKKLSQLEGFLSKGLKIHSTVLASVAFPLLGAPHTCQTLLSLTGAV